MYVEYSVSQLLYCRLYVLRICGVVHAPENREEAVFSFGLVRMKLGASFHQGTYNRSVLVRGLRLDFNLVIVQYLDLELGTGNTCQ